MGQDIHTHAFLKSKVEDRYIDVCEIFYRDSKYSEFPDLVDGRNYSFFSLFGSLRGSCPELPRINYGISEKLPVTFRKYMEEYCEDYHTHSWFHLKDLRDSVNEYIGWVNNPATYIVQNPEMDEEDKEFILSMFSDDENSEKNWILPNLLEMQKRINRIYEYVNDPSYSKSLNNLIDIDKSIICFWFDN